MKTWRSPQGGKSEDSRLSPLDLRGKLTLVELLLLGHDGKPLKEVRVQLSSADGWDGSKTCDEQGRLLFALPRGAGAFYVQFAGATRQTANAVPRRADAHLL